jgi:hypothetical protein
LPGTSHRSPSAHADVAAMQTARLFGLARRTLLVQSTRHHRICASLVRWRPAMGVGKRSADGQECTADHREDLSGFPNPPERHSRSFSLVQALEVSAPTPRVRSA